MPIPPVVVYSTTDYFSCWPFRCWNYLKSVILFNQSICLMRKRNGVNTCCVASYKLSFSLLYCQHVKYCDLLLTQVYWIVSCDFSRLKSPYWSLPVVMLSVLSTSSPKMKFKNVDIRMWFSYIKIEI